MSRRKNVVFLVLDSMRKDRLSPYNQEIDFTDNIQEIADSSVVYDDAVAQAPWTLPSHASMFTGEYPWEHGANQARSYFEEDRDTLITDFKDEGYRTAAITSNIWITPQKGMTSDFDYVENFLGTANSAPIVKISRISAKIYDNMNKTLKRVIGRQLDRLFRFVGVDDSCKSEETLEEVENFLDEQDSEENFFLYVNIMEPHEPYHPPMHYQEKHGVEDISKVAQRQKDLFTKDIDFEEVRKIYDASADYTDDLVGRLTDALDRNDLDEDTVIVLLSDHGQALGEDDLFGHQFTVMDPVIDTALMIRDPDSDADRQEETMELRKLNDIVPYHAGIAEEPEEMASGVARGGYEYPENFIGYVPKERWDEFYRKYRYVKKDGKKIVKTFREDKEPEYDAYDIETGEELDATDDLKKEVDKLGDMDISDEERERDVEEEEEIKERLEELGYR